MATRVIPPEITSSSADIWGPLSEWIKATVRSGDVVENPRAGWEPKCDKDLEFDVPGIRWNWNGVEFHQVTARPYAGPARAGCEILPDRKHVRIPATGQPLLSPDINWGYCSAPDLIARGTHITLDANRRGGTLDRLASRAATGVTLTFTSKRDRGRCGFRIHPEAKDFEHHDWTHYGPVPNPVFTPFELEAQHGVDLVGAPPGLLDGGWARNLYGDGIYYGASGATKCRQVEAINGGIINVARSGVVPVQQIGCSISRYIFDEIGRTLCNFEPPAPDGWSEDWSLTDSWFGSHGLTLLSSGGNPDAHVGRITLARNAILEGVMSLWLTVGSASHRRGPYIIDANKQLSSATHGGTYPTAALICIANANTGSAVTNNTGIKLQKRSPTMAVCRFKNSGVVDVHGNEQTGGIETGPWINP